VQSGLVGLDDQQVVGVLVGDQPVGVLTLGVLRIRGPLADRGQRPGAGQHCAHRHGQHRAQRMPAAASPSRIGELGWEMMSRQARQSGLDMGFDTA
jgi:hypothetical protein